MNIYITQNSFFFVHKYFLNFFEDQNTEIIFVKEKKRGVFRKYKEIFKNFGLLNILLVMCGEIILRILLYQRFINLSKTFINDNELNQFLEIKLKNGKFKRIISIGCPCKISTDFITKYKTQIVNIHGGIIPYQRGRFSPIKSIRKNHKFLGVTIHHISDVFDYGEIISQDYFELKDKNILKNYNRVLKLSSRLLNLYLQKKFKKIPKKIKKYLI